MPVTKTRLRTFLTCLIIPVAYAAAYGPEHRYFVPGTERLLVSFPAGVAMAAALTGPYWLLVLIPATLALLGACAAITWGTVLSVATGDVLSAVLGAFLTHRFLGGTPRLSCFRDVLLTGLLCAGLGMGCGSAVVALAMPEAAGVSGMALWRQGWVSGAIGMALLTPALVAWLINWRVHGTIWRWFEAAALLASLVLANQLASGHFDWVTEDLPDFILFFPPVVWASLRFGPREVATIILLISSLGFLEATPHGAYSVWWLEGICSPTALLLAAVVSERWLAQASLASREGVFKETEQRLHRSEMLLAEAQRVAHLGNWTWDLASNEVVWSDELYRIYGVKKGEFNPIFKNFISRLHPEDRDSVAAVLLPSYRKRRPYRSYHRLVRPDGTIRFIHGSGHVEKDEQGHPVRMYGTAQDITDIIRQESWMEGEKWVFEAISRRVKLQPILERLCRNLEGQGDGLLCSILCRDQDTQCLRHAAGASLPESYVSQLDAVPIGPKAGSCGTAAFRKEAVIVEDILQDPLWEDFRALAEAHGLRSCWSVPIFSTEQEVIGAFAAYHRFPKAPTSSDLVLIERASYLAGIAIERERMEENLRRSEGLFRTISEQMPSSLLLLDLDNPGAGARIIHANQAACQIHGYSPEELLGKPLTLLESEETSIRCSHELPNLLSGAQVLIEGFHRRKDGSLFPVECVCQLIDAGGRKMALSVGRDLTEHQKFENALRLIVEGTASATGDEFFRALVRSLANVLGAKFSIIAEVIEEQPDVARVLAVWDASTFREPFTYALAGTPCETVLSNKTGFCYYPEQVASRFPLDTALQDLRVESYAGIPLINEDGQRLGIMSVLDTKPMHESSLIRSVVTIFAARAAAELSRIRAEEKRLQMERKLFDAQKLESLGILAGGIAHDFNNILTSVLGNVSMARTETSELSPIRPFLESIEAATQNAADLARQMLAYSGRGNFNVKPIDLNALILEMVHLLVVAIPKSVHLHYDLSEDLRAIEADATQVRQVIMNLVINGAEAIGNKQGHITIHTRMISADADYLSEFPSANLKPGEYIALEVSDTGCGMDKETQSRIFDPFFSTKFTGRGLGLAAVLGIARGHQGALKVYSELGKGTTFKIIFPSTEKPAALQSPPQSDGLGLERGTILVVDDEETVRAVVERILQREGCEVLLTSDGPEGIAAYRDRSSEIDLVLLDMTMPQMNGEETFLELRRINPNSAVVLMSGYNEQEATLQFAGKGLNGFLQKPFRREDLLEVIRKALAARRQGQPSET